MGFPITVGYASTTSYDSIHTLRGRIEAFAGSDIWAGTPVTWAQSGAGSTNLAGYAVVMCASQNDEPLGFARDFATAGTPVTVFDYGNILRETVAASTNAGQHIGVVGIGASTHPLSLASVKVPTLGPVAPGSTSNYSGSWGASAVPSSYNAVWSIGEAVDTGLPGQGVAIRVNPRLLSGLA